ncbi:MAG: hypothetical protein IT269_09325 [Saprospiraceae bacterium]|nr:hypothetical protein [Saprospiraceae bacterium]
MTKVHHFISAFLCCCGFISCQGNPASQTAVAPVAPTPTVAPDTVGLPVVKSPIQIDGLTFVAPPEPFPENPMPAVTGVGANWIAVVPYAYTRANTPSVRFSETNWQWWGERPEGICETIRLAHKNDLKVMLKPQVYIPGSWTGSLDFATTSDWEQWEAGYTRYIMRFAKIADSMSVDMLCIGTEFRTSIAKRPEFWKQLIQQVKHTYHGKLTYSSNWDDWDSVPFWAELDFIGLGGYFPLVEGATPDVTALQNAWKPICSKLETFSRQQGKPVIFTEFGYLSVDGAGWRNWELENGIESRNINEQAQANCYEALFSTFHDKSWWAGGFLWKWFPNMRGHEGYPERDYTPQGKIGEGVLKKWYEM